jgi:hypothetical protein
MSVGKSTCLKAVSMPLLLFDLKRRYEKTLRWQT